MRRKATLFGAGLMAMGGVFAMAPPALAACVGTTGTIIVCVDPTGRTLYEDCVMVVDPPCKPVSVPGPSVWCEGAMGPNCDPWH
jgi:hypothetical protein